MFTTLEDLKEQDLRIYPLAELIKVLEALNNVSLSQMNYVTATETLDSYLAFVDTINERINSGTLEGIDTKQKTELLQYIKKLRDRLNNFKVLSSFMLANQRTFYLYVDKMKNETAEKINKTTTNLTEKIDTATSKLEESEHNILTHVLTLMGVFSAVIISIMSVVITTTSWLNSSNVSDAITAFIVPSAVTCITVIFLLSVIYGLYGERKGRWLFYIYIGIVAIGLVVIIFQYKYQQDQIGEVVHTRYILEKAEYNVVENDSVLCCEFIIDNVKYVCPYNDMLLHDNNALHFCIQHEALE